jgi:predicted NAD/FAD-binding protein
MPSCSAVLYVSSVFPLAPLLSFSQKPVVHYYWQIVFNPPTYPNFLRFLKLHSSIEIIKTQMTFSVSRDGGAFEWAGDGLRSVFCQPKRVFDLGMWRMLFDIMRFNACAVRVLSEKDDLSIGEYLRREGYSSRFRDDYLIVCVPQYTFLSVPSDRPWLVRLYY